MLKLLALIALSSSVMAQTPSWPQVESINSSHCVLQEYSDMENATSAYRIHFYNSDRFDPLPIPPNFDFSGFCHNRSLYGEIDSAVFPRLGLREAAFNVFMDRPMNVAAVEIEAPSSPLQTMTRLGFGILPEVLGSVAVCPSYSGIETEALYALASTAKTGLGDRLLASRSELEGAWFYMKNGVAVRPSTATELTRTLYVFWPIDSTMPTVKSPGQQLYRIIHNGGPVLPDHSIGCVPKMGQQAGPELASVGASCSYDTDCSTLICSKSTNRCVTGTSELHPRGSECIASFQCEIENVSVFRITYLGRDEIGNPICHDLSSPQLTHGLCIKNSCRPARNIRVVADFQCN